MGRDQFIKLEATLAIKVNNPRNIPLDYYIAHFTANHALGCSGKITSLVGGRCSSGRHANHDNFPACSKIVWRGGVGARCAHCDKNCISTSTEGGFGLLPRGCASGQNPMSSSKFHGDV